MRDWPSCDSTWGSGGVGPILFGVLICAGNGPSRLFIGYLIGSVIMVAGAIVEILLGVAAGGQTGSVAAYCAFRRAARAR